jgi:hypothetical protein
MSDFLIFLPQFIQNILSFWWLWLAIILYPAAKYLYLWTIREINFYNKINWVLLEIKPPATIEKTPKAMENVFHTIWTLYDPPATIRDYWLKGQWLLYYSLEIVGRKGEMHFYIRTPKTHKSLVEYALYAEYPDIEIKEVEDYVKKFGELPNEKYDIWGTDQRLTKPDVYPIRTYTYWETEMSRPEKITDPFSTLFEHLTGLEEDEECWIQIKISPSANELRPYSKEAQKVVNEIMKRAVAKEAGTLESLHFSKAPWDILDVLVEGSPIPERTAQPETPGFDIGLMKLSPGETEVLRAIEENIGKYFYEANIRFLYIANREIFSPPRGVAPLVGFFSQFSSLNLNGLAPDKTKTKVMPWFFEKRRLFMKKRKLYRYYASRMWPWHRAPYVFSTAELATLFHFPSKQIAPSIGIPRIEVRKGAPPPNLPS